MKPLASDTARHWMSVCHIALLNSLIAQTRFSCRDIAFQGGTSLHLTKGSPRFSNDLDFLLAKSAGGALSCCLENIRSQANRFVTKELPGVSLRLKPVKVLSDGRLFVVGVVASHPEYHGNVHVRMEFWEVSDDYLAGYGAQTNKNLKLKISSDIPSGSLETILADKLLALGNRRFVKWRDLFDVWWISNQSMLKSIDTNELAKKVLFNATAYDIDNLHTGWLRLSQQEDELASQAEADLSPFLGEGLAKILFPEQIRPILRHSQDLIAMIIKHEPQLQNEHFYHGMRQRFQH